MRGYFLVGGAAASWGLWPLVLRSAARFGPVDASMWAAALMAVTTIATAPSLIGCKLHRIPRRVLVLAALLGVSDAANAWCFFQAYRETTVALAISTHYLAPILVAVLGPLVGDGPAPRRALLAACAGFSGLLLVLDPLSTTLDRGAVVGSAFGVASAFAYAANIFLNRRIGDALTGAQVMAIHGIVATPLLMAVTSADAWRHAAPGTLGVAVAAGFTIGAGSGVAFVSGLRFIPTVHGAVLTFLEPIVALALGVGVLGEILTAQAFVGALVVVAAGVIVVMPRRRTADSPEGGATARG